MSRVLSFLGLIVACCFTSPTTVSQENDVHVTLFAFAEFELFFAAKFDNVRYPPITEHKIITDWVQNPYNKSRSPDHFELVAIVVNRGTLPVDSIELELNRDRKIGELWDFETEPRPSGSAQWEGSIPIATTVVGTVEEMTATVVRFGPFSASDLYNHLLAEERWPWEVRFEVALECSDCSPVTDSASIKMHHSL